MKPNIKKEDKNFKNIFGLILGPLSFAIIYWMIPLENLSNEGRGVLATLVWMAIWWMLEILPSGITGLIPLVVFPLTKALPAGEVASAYGNNTVFLLMGGFAIGLAIKKWNFHNIIAINILNLVGASSSGLFFGILLTSTFVSMWVSNVATSIMILPIATAIGSKMVELMRKESSFIEKDAENFEKSILVAVVFGAIIGGSITLIGTPTNTALQGFYNELYGKDLAFGKFTLFEIPIAIVQIIVLIIVTTKIYYPIRKYNLRDAKTILVEEKRKLGKMSPEQKAVSYIFVITAFMWVTRTFIWKDILPGINDGMIAMVATILLFMIPTKSDNKKHLLDKSDINNLSWDVLLMIAGGMAIAKGFSGTDLAQWIGQQLLVFQNASSFVVLLMVILLSITVTQFAPNTATGSILIPIAATLGDTLGVDPLPLMTAAALGSGFAFTFPSGTPAMGVLYGTGRFKIADLLKLGIPLVITSIVMILAAVYLWLPFTLV